jgi:hypothetical protein
VDLHTSGDLKPAAPGIMEGEIVFPVRGTLAFRLERRPNDDKGGQSARLFCLSTPPSDCEMALIEAAPEDDWPSYWHGFLGVEGYVFQVRAVRAGKVMAVSFLDAKQPVWCPEAAALIGERAA